MNMLANQQSSLVSLLTNYITGYSKRKTGEIAAISAHIVKSLLTKNILFALINT